MKAYVYILKSKTSGKYYIGSSSNLERRLKQHRRGHTHTTKRIGDWELVFFQDVATLEMARKAERRIKTWKRKDYIDKIVEDGKINFL